LFRGKLSCGKSHEIKKIAAIKEIFWQHLRTARVRGGRAARPRAAYPMSPEDLERKFLTLAAAAVSNDASATCMAHIERLEHEAHVAISR
jgi:hypothetical protein